MLRPHVIWCFLLLLLGGCRSGDLDSEGRYQVLTSIEEARQLPSVLSVSRTDGQGLFDVSNRYFPVSVPLRNRARWNVSPQMFRHNGEHVVAWFGAWNRPGSSDPGALVVFRQRIWIRRAGRNYDEVWHDQFYTVGQTVWGGWWPYSETEWFKSDMEDKEDFKVGFVFRDMNAAAVLITGDHDEMAGHIWTTTWPRLELPADAVELGVSVTAMATGEAVFHFGIDQYQSADSSDEPAKEIMGSWTYTAQHGLVTAFIRIPVVP